MGSLGVKRSKVESGFKQFDYKYSIQEFMTKIDAVIKIGKMLLSYLISQNLKENSKTISKYDKQCHH